MPEVLKISSDKPESALIAKAVNTLKKGGVIAYPTETFYGLGVDGGDEKAIEKIFRIKGRNFKNPVSVIIGDDRDIIHLAEDVPEISRKLMKIFWPGALTIVFKASSHVSHLLTAGTGKIGVRVSSHPITAALSKAFAHPITATSANVSGVMECTNAAEVIQCIGDRVDLVIDGGQTPGIMGSTIIDVTTSPPVILRAGIIPAALLSEVIVSSMPLT